MRGKYIIIKNKNGDDEVIMGNVEFHYELIGNNYTTKDVIGGGRFTYEPKLYGEFLFFYGKSDDFGKVNKEQFKDVWKNSLCAISHENKTIIFSEKEYFSDMEIGIDNGNKIKYNETCYLIS